MIPLRDNIPSRTVPLINYLMILACTLVFLMQLLAEGSPDAQLVERFGMIPARVLRPERPVPVREVHFDGRRVVESVRPAAATPFPPWATLVTCIFLHGGWMHFLSNMWVLYIFGDNVEDRVGHLAYLIFYVGCGVAASLAHLLTNASSPIPTIGASGAIAGVMGAYFLLYPRAQVVSLIPIFFFLQIVVLPAPVFLGFWFLLQFFQGTMSVTDVQTGGVAWWAHIGGFVAGFIVAAGLRAVGETRPPVEQVRPDTERVRAYPYRRREW